MKTISLILSLISLFSGSWAAYLWYLASNIKNELPWTTEPVNETLSGMGWTSALWLSTQKSAALNSRASIATAISVAASVVSSCISTLLT